MDAKVIWKGRLSFDGSADTGFTLPLGARPNVGGDDDGFRPIELFLVGLAGCTGMDVISILQKKRQKVTEFQVHAHAERADDHPKVFTKITLEFQIKGQDIDNVAVERAIELSETQYCPAHAMLSHSVTIESSYTIDEAEKA